MWPSVPSTGGLAQNISLRPLNAIATLTSHLRDPPKCKRLPVFHESWRRRSRKWNCRRLLIHSPHRKRVALCRSSTASAKPTAVAVCTHRFHRKISICPSPCAPRGLHLRPTSPKCSQHTERQLRRPHWFSPKSPDRRGTDDRCWRWCSRAIGACASLWQWHPIRRHSAKWIWFDESNPSAAKMVCEPYACRWARKMLKRRENVYVSIKVISNGRARCNQRKLIDQTNVHILNIFSSSKWNARAVRSYSTQRVTSTHIHVCVALQSRVWVYFVYEKSFGIHIRDAHSFEWPDESSLNERPFHVLVRAHSSVCVRVIVSFGN